MKGLGDTASSVLCDGSATVTVRMKEGQTLTKETVEKVFAETTDANAKKWKAPAGFAKSEHKKPVASYAITYAGGT